jgi:hypothetical protein
MDQSEIDALMKNSGKAPAKPKADVPGAKAPSPDPEPKKPEPLKPEPHADPEAGVPRPDEGGHVISELDSVTSVTERETNKLLDQLDQISRLVGRQQSLITEMMKDEGSQAPEIQKAIHEVMSSAKEIQDKVFEAMDLMQFQDITRQKLERIVYHLRQIHDYIVELLGTGLKSDRERASISHTIASTSTKADENKAHADSVVEEFLKQQKKG